MPLRAHGLSKEYRGRRVLDGVDLELSEGRILGLVGANGAGKTTTLKILSGLVEPTQGHVDADGEDPLKPAARRRLGYVPEDSPVYDDLSASAYLDFFARLFDVPAATGRKRAGELLDRLRLAPEHRDRPLGTLSKGMRRKVALARALLYDPPYLILDEPTSGLDPPTTRELGRFLLELRGEGKAILLSAHNLPQVEELCDEIVVLHQGRVSARGTVAELRQRAGATRYRVRATVPFPGSRPETEGEAATLDSLEDVRAALRVIEEQGGALLHLDAISPGLEPLLGPTMEE